MPSHSSYRWCVSRFLGVTYSVGIGLLLKTGPASERPMPLADFIDWLAQRPS